MTKSSDVIRDVEMVGSFPSASLPHPESMFREEGGTGQRMHKKWILLLLFSFAGLVAIIVGLAVSFAKRKSELKSNAPSTIITNEASDEVIDEANDLFTESTSVRFNNVVRYLEVLTDRSALDAPDSAQNLATRWIADEDSKEMMIPDDFESISSRQFIERWALAVFFYATSGPEWAYRHVFVTESDTCQWGALLFTGVSIIRTGVTCNDDGLVVDLILPHNKLTGSLPAELEQIRNLRLLSLNYNSLNGELPSALQSLTQMVGLILDYNQISGSFPSWIGSLSSLLILGFSNNAFTGSLPDSISDLTQLDTFSVDDNFMNGGVAKLSTLTTLRYLHLEDNEFSSNKLGTDFNMLRRLVVLDVSNNNFQGPLPSDFLDASSYPTLETLDLHGNQFTGNFPLDIPENEVLKYLTVHDNSIGGSVTSSPLNNLKALTHLDLSSNDITGEIPSYIASMNRLTFLFLANNSFVPGPIPDFLQSLTELRELSLKTTGRTGTIPALLGLLDQLVLLDLDDNSLKGPIPAELGQLSNLKFLLLNRNELTGTLPAGLERLSSLVMILIEKNSIVGNGDVICNKDKAPELFIADCGSSNEKNPELLCSCCNECCHDENEAACNDEGLLANYDLMWEFGYTRVNYEFTNEDIFPTGGN